MKIDLHVHSNFSFDSTESIETILAEMKKKEISKIAICDHNTIEGSELMKKYLGDDCISGIEIDAISNDYVHHILGYGFQYDDEFRYLEGNYMKELQRVNEIRLALVEERYQCTLDRDKLVSLKNKRSPVTNVEIERVLLMDVQHEELVEYQHGSKSSNPIASYYWDHMAVGKWCYVPMNLPLVQQTIDMIHRHGGIAVLAHPKVTVGRNIEELAVLKKCGIDGIEVYCSYHDHDDVAFYKQWALENHCCMTVGSDFHGVTKPNIQLGDSGFKGDGSEIIEKILMKVRGSI